MIALPRERFTDLSPRSRMASGWLPFHAEEGLTRKMSLVVASVVLVIMCIFGLPPANAQQNPKSAGMPPTDVSGTQISLSAVGTPPGSGFGCDDFDVVIELNGKASTITLPGVIISNPSPGLFTTVTNVTDPTKSVTFNITGTLHNATDASGTTTHATGRNLLGDPVAGFVLAVGSWNFKFNATGVLVQPLDGIGQLTHVCPLIE